MKTCRKRYFRKSFSVLLSFSLVSWAAATVSADPIVPGTGTRVAYDDMEDPAWSYELNLPKASSNLDNQERQPGGSSANGKWYESSLRGEPDLIKRVPTPAGGLPGSKGAMLLRTLNSGMPTHHTSKFQQDDLVFNASMSTGGYISPSRTPNVVVRVYLPPFDQWEKRTGTSFGIRADVIGTFHKKDAPSRGFFRRAPATSVEPFWPGMFIQFNSKTDGQNQQDSATILVRANEYGQDIPSTQITQTGWWTFGMTFTPDGMVHYYAKPGVGKLTAADRLASTVPYGTKVENFNTIFFNVVNMDDGRTWSTEWIVDDPEIYVLY
jgi:hypothetical protein